MDWPSFLRGVLAMAVAVFVVGFGWWHFTAPVDPRSRAAKALSKAINEGTYSRRRRSKSPANSAQGTV
jgi:hypothetical protein